MVDKHSVGGLPGNRTTPIVVSIVTSCGLTMPKTSSRAITSPAGTADTMETLAPVALDLATMRRVVEQEGGCIAWGGAVRLSPADDILISVERALDLDSEGQLIASVLSKKIAAGSSHVVLDIPVGPTAKVRNAEDAHRIAQGLVEVAEAFGLKAKPVFTDGTQPVGRGIGPALEARDVLAVLDNAAHAPHDLRERAVLLAATLLELAGKAPEGTGHRHGGAGAGERPGRRQVPPHLRGARRHAHAAGRRAPAPDLRRPCRPRRCGRQSAPGARRQACRARRTTRPPAWSYT